MTDPALPPIYTPPAQKTTRGLATPRTRMATRLIPIPRVYDPEGDKVKKTVKKPARRAVQLRGRAPIDDQFEVKLYFSPAYGTDAGRTYGASLGITPGVGSPEGNKEFYVRAEVTQHRVDPLLQGFRLDWEPPPGWTAQDGIGGTTYDEAISNPLYVNRVYLSPAAPSVDVGWRVIARKKYRP